MQPKNETKILVKRKNQTKSLPLISSSFVSCTVWNYHCDIVHFVTGTKSKADWNSLQASNECTHETGIKHSPSQFEATRNYRSVTCSFCQ